MRQREERERRMRMEQVVTDHGDTQAAYNAALSALRQEEAKPNPDPARVAQLFQRVAELQTQLGELEDDPVFDVEPVAPDQVEAAKREIEEA
ncbi:MAG: hypothetical protein E6I27_16040 [Chloroflexi bacterium]|nr:MAG: hypothetical protein E6I27_16040 [Chloroflexota bacterium]